MKKRKPRLFWPSHLVAEEKSSVTPQSQGFSSALVLIELDERFHVENSNFQLPEIAR